MRGRTGTASGRDVRRREALLSFSLLGDYIFSFRLGTGRWIRRHRVDHPVLISTAKATNKDRHHHHRNIKDIGHRHRLRQLELSITTT